MKFGIKQALGSLVCLLALSALQAARADDAVKLARVYKEKDTASYKQVNKITVSGMDVVRTIVTKDTVKELKPTGDTVVLREIVSDQVEINGSPMDIPGDPVTLTYDKAGKLSDYAGAKDGGPVAADILRLIATTHHFVLPNKAVKKDDKWETEVDDPAVKGKKMTLTSTFLGIEKHDGKDLWKIKQTTEALADDTGGKVTAEITALLDPTTGQLIHSEGSMKDVPSMYGPLTWTEETDLQKPDDAKKS